VSRVQATVSFYDAESRSGRVLLDDGVELPFAATALADERSRLLRPGQRVRVVVEEATVVTRLQILTLAD